MRRRDSRSPRSFRLWHPLTGQTVRVVLGRHRGAIGIVRWKRSRWGMATIELRTGAGSTPGGWVEVRAWQVGPESRDGLGPRR